MTTPNALHPNVLTPADLEPNWRWEGRLPAWGHTSVDFERRVDHDRLRRYRLSRTRQALKASNAGTLLLFDVNNIRYVSATKIGEWERDKMCRFCLLTGDDSPYVWDFGSAAVHHQKYSDWLEPDHCLAGVVGMRGTIPPEFGLMKKYAKQIAGLIKDAGMADMDLMMGDSIRLYSKSEVLGFIEPVVKIKGYVKRPGTYDVTDGMKIVSEIEKYNINYK